MALQQTPQGLEIETQAEIQAALEASHRAQFGNEIQLDPSSVFGKQVGIWSEREALIQQELQDIQSGFDRNAAEGASLDAVVALFGSIRRGASASQSKGFRLFGVDTTVIADASLFTQDITGIVWSVINGPYTIGDVTPGQVDIEAQATTVGANVFSTASTFVITTPIAGWTSATSFRDIEGFETGSGVEEDPTLRDRSRDELFAGGNDITAIKAVVTKVLGVDEVQVFENRDCGNTVDGIPPGAFEVVVTDGEDIDIANAILSRKPPGAETFGSTTVNLADSEGNTIPIMFTRPALVEIHVQINVLIAGAEGTLPENAEDVVKQAVLDFANANSRVGQDVLFQQFIGPTFVAIQDIFTGKFPTTSIISEIGFSPAPGVSEINIPISDRERADFDSTRIVVFFT